MSNSLRDQLLGLGYKPVPEAPKQAKPETGARPARERGRPDSKAGGRPPQGRPESGPGNRPAHTRPAQDRAASGRPSQGRPAQADRGRPSPKPASRPEFDLGKAYALRAQHEKDERIAVEKEKQEQARLRREARAKLALLMEGKALNDPAAEHVRHFEYGGKIKRVHVTAEQLVRLNAGELGVVQAEGRYLLVDAGMLAEAEAVFADAVALKVDPNAPAADDPYSDPAYQVPDDLIW